jgi:hypothetical protein
MALLPTKTSSYPWDILIVDDSHIDGLLGGAVAEEELLHGHDPVLHEDRPHRPLLRRVVRHCVEAHVRRGVEGGHQVRTAAVCRWSVIRQMGSDMSAWQVK